VGGVADDRSKGLAPGPSSYFTRACVVLDPDETERLMRRYRWAHARGKSIPRPDWLLGEGFPVIHAPFRRSNELIRALPSMTEFASGTALLQPQGHLLYLDLRAN
jgi:hypothetical protein